MPVSDTILLLENSWLALWKQDESFQDLLLLYKNDYGHDFSFNSSLSEKRNTEKLITSLLILHLTGLRDYKLSYAPTGKPVLEADHFNFVSISHSGIYTAVILSGQAQVAVDVQQFSTRIKAGADYFLSKNEQTEVGQDATDEWLHVYWCVKETAIKYFDVAGIDFKNNIQVKINEKQKKSKALCEVIKEEKPLKLFVQFAIRNDHVLAYAIQ